MAVQVGGGLGECHRNQGEKVSIFQGEQGHPACQILQSGPVKLGLKTDHWI